MTTELAKIAFVECARQAGMDAAESAATWDDAPEARKHWRKITTAVLEPVLKKLGIDIPSIEYLEDLPEGEFVTRGPD